MSQQDEWDADERAMREAEAARAKQGSKVKLKLLLRVLAAALIATAALGLNGAIYYSSVPHYAQQGWAEFSGLNAVWIFVGGVLLLCFAESHEVAMRQLDLDRKRERAAA